MKMYNTLVGVSSNLNIFNLFKFSPDVLDSGNESLNSENLMRVTNQCIVNKNDEYQDLWSVSLTLRGARVKIATTAPHHPKTQTPIHPSS